MFTIQQFNIVGAIGKVGPFPEREQLYSNRTYYVRVDGNDNNDGLSDTVGGAFSSIQKAVDASLLIDASGYIITIQVRDGTYNECVVLRWHSGYYPIVIQGNTSTIGAVVVNGTGTHTFRCEGNWVIRHLETRNNSAGQYNVIGLYSGCNLTLGPGMQYGSGQSAHVGSYYGARVTVSSNFNISGNAAYGILAAFGGWVYVSNVVCTFIGARTFSTAFIAAQNSSNIRSTGFTWVGTTPTGTRYRSTENSTIHAANASSTYFPGTVAGVLTYGGQYI